MHGRVVNSFRKETCFRKCGVQRTREREEQNGAQLWVRDQTAQEVEWGSDWEASLWV